MVLVGAFQLRKVLQFYEVPAAGSVHSHLMENTVTESEGLCQQRLGCFALALEELVGDRSPGSSRAQGEQPWLQDWHSCTWAQQSQKAVRAELRSSHPNRLPTRDTLHALTPMMPIR